MQERGERYRERMAGVSEAVVDNLGMVHGMRSFRVVHKSKRSAVARRTLKLDILEAGSGAVNLSVLCGGRAVAQVNQKNK